MPPLNIDPVEKFADFAPLFCKLILVLSAVLPISGLAADEKGKIGPLFDVAITHDFPDPDTTFAEIMDLIESQYYADEIDEKSLWWGAIEGMLRHISPEENKTLAAIWMPAEYENVDNILHGVQESIGVKSNFNPIDGSLTVTEVTVGGPSESLLQIYDRIVRIDGNPLKGLSVNAVDQLLKGEPETEVSLKVVRDVQVFDLTVTRETIPVVNVADQLLPDQILWLGIYKFAEGVSDEVAQRLRQKLAQDTPVKGLVLDLRNNSGGVFNEALKCAELFIPKGEAMMRMVSHGDKINTYVSTNEEPFTVPLIVLVNGGSASGSEILAAALRDSAQAFLVGGTTYGKASMERIFTLKNQYRVKFTTAALYSPKGISWQQKGLVPDFPVDQESDVVGKTRNLKPALRLANDRQLLVAHRFLAHTQPAEQTHAVQN